MAMAGGTLQRERTASASGSSSVPAEFVDTRRGSTVWEIQSHFADELLNDAGLNWDEWQQQGALSVVKTGPHRTVYRLDLPCGEFYIKHFRIADWKARLKNVFRASQAEREWNAAHRIAAARLPTFDAVALGKTIRGGTVGESFLITRAIPDAISLDEFVQNQFPRLPPRQQATVRQRLAVELGQLTGQLHRAGFDHADLHAGNVLIRIDADNRPKLWLIDLQAVRSRRTLSDRVRERNLATLNQFFALRAGRADRLRFFRSYLTAMETEQTSRDDELLRQLRLESFLRVMADKGWLRADRAWRRGNRHVRKLDVGTTRCRGLAALETNWLAAIRDDPEKLFTDRLLNWCKRSGRHRVAAIMLPCDVCDVRAYWKCIEERGSIRRWWTAWRESTVRHAWEMGHAFLRRGIATPRPLIYVETKSRDCDRQYLLTEAIPNSVTFDDYLAQYLPKLTSAEQHTWLLAVTRHLAEKLRRMHAANFDHRDLKFQNILVSTEEPQTWLLDLDAVRRWPWFPARRVVQNLARLNVSSLQWPIISHSERVRFLKRYLGERFSSEWKWWWRRIARRSVQKQQQNQRRGRPLT